MRQALKAGNSGLTYQANYEKDLPPTLEDETDRFCRGDAAEPRNFSEITRHSNGKFKLGRVGPTRLSRTLPNQNRNKGQQL